MTLIIKDLVLDKDLDRKDMSVLHGGISQFGLVTNYYGSYSLHPDAPIYSNYPPDPILPSAYK